MADQKPPKRCRLVLITPANHSADDLEQKIGAALEGGDVASLIVPIFDLHEAEFQSLCGRIVAIAHAKGVAVIISGDTRIAARVKADGVHMEAGKAALADAIDRLQDKMNVGAGGIKTRDEALDLGEARPDYIFFGRFNYDNTPEPHPRNLGLAEWWAEMIEIPCILLGGSQVDSVVTAAETGAEYVALSAAVFSEGLDPREQVSRVNELLDQKAPRFES
ncbi:thiamine phosphate synthase [Mesorhizobium sp. NBSH29]|uniref:thiamine phosphate synthase n=1 Tax=Mesorhizobium sp. NBSH29 TaxID=2654249 RepID=UPI0018964A1F|nr:thiamine phosphate synthase [Mesorhizobium sp. NBSH29]QPC85798.1 thiamine phosphate synthase [Mesorhizobium sp. NBSH29]